MENKKEDENDLRIVFRPTTKQYSRISNIYLNSGRYKHLSELMRELVEIGLNKLEEDKLWFKKKSEKM